MYSYKHAQIQFAEVLFNIKIILLSKNVLKWSLFFVLKQHKQSPGLHIKFHVDITFLPKLISSFPFICELIPKMWCKIG